MALLSLLLGFAGVNTSMGQVLSAFGFSDINVNNYESSSIAGKLTFIFGLTIIGGIIASFTGSNLTESFVMGALAGALSLFISDYYNLYIYFKDGAQWAFYLMSLIFIPMIIGYIISLVEWWRGAD